MASKTFTESFCSLHHSELKLFCEDDKQLVCFECQGSTLHKKHNFSPVSEAALEYKKEVNFKLQSLQKKLNNFKQAKTTCDETAKDIGVQAQQTESQIRNVFRTLHRFLRDEEAARIAALRNEEKQKCQMMKKKVEKMRQEISSLSDTIIAIEEEIGANDITFLQNYKSTVKRAQCTLQDPERVSGALINVAKHVGNLKFNVWEKMQYMVQYTPVTLDPNTAHPYILSEDLTSMTRRHGEQWKRKPEGFDQKMSDSVLGSQGFNSGTHCWDVEVGNSKNWILGVKTESSLKEVEFPITSKGAWCFGMADDIAIAHCAHQRPKFNLVRQKPRRIRVQLDWDRGKLSFFDLDKNSYLHTFTYTFTERVFPEFATDLSVKILPVKVREVKKLS